MNKFVLFSQEKEMEEAGAQRDLMEERPNVKENISPSGRFMRTVHILEDTPNRKFYVALDLVDGKEAQWGILTITDEEQKKEVVDTLATSKERPNPKRMEIYEFWERENVVEFIAEQGMSIFRFLTMVKKPISPELIKSWGDRLIQIVKEIYEKDEEILYRQLKAGNVFLTAKGDMKLGFWNVFCIKNRKKDILIKVREEPKREENETERIPLSFKKESERMDVYGFGLIILELAIGENLTQLGNHPYEKPNLILFDYLLRTVLPLSVMKVDNLCIRDIIFGCLTAEEQRFAIDDATEHHFFKMGKVTTDYFDCECITHGDDNNEVFGTSCYDGDLIGLSGGRKERFTDEELGLRFEVRHIARGIFLFTMLLIKEEKEISFYFNERVDTMDVIGREMEEAEIIKDLARIEKAKVRMAEMLRRLKEGRISSSKYQDDSDDEDSSFKECSEGDTDLIDVYYEGAHEEQT